MIYSATTKPTTPRNTGRKLGHILFKPSSSEHLVAAGALHINVSYPPPIASDPSGRRVPDRDPLKLAEQ